MPNVKLAIRVRPFTDRELKSDKDCIPVVNVADEHTVTITNTKVSVSGAGDSRKRIRRYYADYTFDSACEINLPSYTSQEKVFETIGREVIDSVLRGSSACVMAYGQSATGKTHTMMGSDAQPGLVPRLCRALADIQPIELTVSFLEIYNERVHDLLVEATPACHSLPRRRGNARKDLRVREHPTRGPYVQNLRRVAVNDVESLLALVSEGARRRRTAATRRNATSSRSHALIDIVLPHRTLHLADLAGSEKASWEGYGTGGGRQKEGSNINKSLVALSNVISALVSGSNGRGRFVPYRDSALTWLLKDCFTGGASTFIIATVSPSIACYGESASTLRWSERARQLPTPKLPTSGINVTSKADLQAQLNHLIAELSRNFIQYTPETGKISYDDCHWKLHVSNNNLDGENAKATIGSIMNKFHPKLDSESTASSVASGSSDIINTIDKNIKIVEEINKEVDKLFVPALERTSSSSDLKVVAPLRHKRRQYRSQEILQLDEAIAHQSNSITSLPSQNHGNEQSQKPKVPRVPILHDNQRAEIVASVTDRLYSKLKKKEEAAVSKMESMVDKKIMEPLSELRICTNARQRLMELSQKAMRNKRRIGIPAYTQTRISVIRVKDQSVDVQTDLESYIAESQRSFKLYRDVGTETIPMTPRCKEVAVGSKYGTLNLSDRSTITENKKVVCKNSCVMTDVPGKCEQCTQTLIVPPPRRKKQALLDLGKYMKNNNESIQEETISPVININISSTYTVDSESQSSDDNAEPVKNNTPKKVTLTPDLLTNHCDMNVVEQTEPNVININNAEILQGIPNNITEKTTNISESAQLTEEFPDLEDCALPRVTIDQLGTSSGQIKNIILGRNANMYPYNIVLSPTKERDSKRLVSFQSCATRALDMASQTDWDSNNEEVGDDLALSESKVSDSTDASKVETDSFIWKQGSATHNTKSSLRYQYNPVYKTNPRYKTTRAKFYREFLGLENDFSTDDKVSYSYSSSDNLSQSYEDQPIHRFKRANIRPCLQYQNIERSLLNSCDDLDGAVNNYEGYLYDFKNQKKGDQKNSPAMTPTEYLKHLIKLRRDVVKMEGVDST